MRSITNVYKLTGIIVGLACGMLLAITHSSSAQQKSEEAVVYTVKEGDYLLKIATNYGNPNFWAPIYEANRDIIKNPDLIYPGQQLLIPPEVSSSAKFMGDASATKEAAGRDLDKSEKEKLEAFRRAFNELTKPKNPEYAEPRSSGNGLEFGGLVINETRSKMGSDFFNVFYKYWEAPQNSGNFILKITEQPIPSLGTMVSIKIDDRLVFKSRLQPRYAVIENLAKQAVMVSYRNLQHHMQNQNEMVTY